MTNRYHSPSYDTHWKIMSFCVLICPPGYPPPVPSLSFFNDWSLSRPPSLTFLSHFSTTFTWNFTDQWLPNFQHRQLSLWLEALRHCLSGEYPAAEQMSFRSIRPWILAIVGDGSLFVAWFPPTVENVFDFKLPSLKMSKLSSQHITWGYIQKPNEIPRKPLTPLSGWWSLP